MVETLRPLAISKGKSFCNSVVLPEPDQPVMPSKVLPAGSFSKLNFVLDALFKEDEDAMKLDIWEFVRLMVAVEQEPGNPLMQAFAQQWQEVDQALTELAQEDHIAYSDMMLNQQIDLGDLTRQQSQAAIDTFTQVIAEIKKLEAKASAPEEVETFKLERKALAKTVKRLKR